VFLAFDVGTTSMKCVLFGKDFKQLCKVSYEYDLLYPQEDFVELGAEVYYETFCRCIKSIKNSGIDVNEIKSLTFTTQGETFVPVDKNGNHLNRAIIWLDARASKEAELLLEKLGLEKIYQKTGLCGIDGALPLAKLMWIKENMPELYNSTYKFLLLEDYLIMRLTGEFVTEKSLVSSTCWYNIVDDCFFDEALSVGGIDIEKLPKVLPCGEVVGKVSADASRECGLCCDTAVVTGAMDQISSAIGAGNFCEGVVTETTGTALVVGATVSKPVFDLSKPITIYKHFDHKFMYMPFCNTAGVVLKWFKDTVAGEIVAKANAEDVSPYFLIDEMAKLSQPGSRGVMLLPHFSGKNAPDEIPEATGCFFGLTLATDMKDLCRSVLEGIAYMLRENIEVLEAQGVEVSEIKSLGGGSSSPLWGEIKASVCCKKIVRNGYSETTALGAAILGSVAVSEYASVEEAYASVDVKSKDIMPVAGMKDVYDAAYKKYKELYQALKSVF